MASPVTGSCCSSSFSSSSSSLSAICCIRGMWGVGYQHWRGHQTLPGDRDRSQPPSTERGLPKSPHGEIRGGAAEPLPCQALSLGSPVLAVPWRVGRAGQAATKAGLSLLGRAAPTGNVGNSSDPSTGLFQQETLRWAGLSDPQDHVGSTGPCAGQVGAWWRHILCPCDCTNPV